MTTPTPPKVPTDVWLSACATCVVLVIAGLVQDNTIVLTAGLAGLGGLGVVPRA
jgi:hypothetical protein